MAIIIGFTWDRIKIVLPVTMLLIGVGFSHGDGELEGEFLSAKEEGAQSTLSSVTVQELTGTWFITSSWFRSKPDP